MGGGGRRDDVMSVGERVVPEAGVRGVLRAVGGVTVATAGLSLGRHVLALDKAHVGLVFLLVVAWAAASEGTRAALVAAVTSFLAWDFFFLPPYFTFVISDPADWILLFVFLVIALLIGSMTGRVRAREEEAVARSRETEALYASSMAVGRFAALQDALPAVLEPIMQGTRAVGCAVVRYRVRADGTVMGGSSERAATGTGGGAVAVGPSEGVEILASIGDVSALHSVQARRFAGWVTLHVKAVGLSTSPSERGDVALWPFCVSHEHVLGTHEEPHRRDVFLPLTQGNQSYGLLFVALPTHMDSSRVAEERLMVAFANHAASCLERDRLLEETRNAARQQETERLRTVLFESLSHNLKTPLASLTATLSSLRGDDVQWNAELVGEGLEMMAEDLARLTENIDNLLSLAQLESGHWTPQREWIEVREVVSVARRQLPMRDHARIAFDGREGERFIYVDPLQMAQVIRHLLENALTYSPPASPVALSVDLEEGVPTTLVMRVDDRGPGITADEMDRVFRKFYRGDAAVRTAARGTGLGLAICRSIVEAHGGTIQVGRNDWGGASFVVRIGMPVWPAVAD